MARLHEYQGKAILAANGFKSRAAAQLQLLMKLSQQRKNSAAKLSCARETTSSERESRWRILY